MPITRLLLTLAPAALLVACGDDTTGSGGAGGASTTASSATTTGAGSTSSGTGGSGDGGGGGDVTSGTGGSGGAGGGSPADDRFRSGDRLRAIVIEGGGDARNFDGWFDSQLEVECSDVLAQGVVRCMPMGFQVKFLDDACTQPVVVGQECAPFPTYTTRFVRSQVACNADDAQHYDAFHVTGADEVPEVLYDLGLDGVSCNASGGNVTVRRAEQVDVDLFVELTTAEEPIDDQISRVVQTGSDGSFQVVGAFDVERGAYCAEMSPPPEDGSRRCAPGAKRRYLGFSYWGDDTCGEPAVTLNNCELDADFAVIDYRLDDCNVEHGVLHERGEVLPGPLFETFGTNGECLEQNPALLGAGLGAAIDTATLPLLELTLVEGPSLSVEIRSRAGRAVSAYGSFHDPSGAHCRGRRAIDGTLRCVPYGLGDVGNDYADAACTIPLARAGAFDVGCGLATRAERYVESPEACGEQELQEIVHLGPLHEGPVYYLSGDACTEDAPGATLYATLTDEVDAIETLPTLEIVIE